MVNLICLGHNLHFLAPIIPNPKHDLFESSFPDRTKSFCIQYIDEEVLLNEAIVFQLEVDIFQVTFSTLFMIYQFRLFLTLGFYNLICYIQRKKSTKYKKRYLTISVSADDLVVVNTTQLALPSFSVISSPLSVFNKRSKSVPGEPFGVGCCHEYFPVRFDEWHFCLVNVSVHSTLVDFLYKPHRYA
jgi:hypothetical protein